MKTTLARAFALILTVVVVDMATAQFRARIATPAEAQGGSLSAGDIVIRVSGNCGAGFAEVATLSGKVLRGTVAANMDQGGTGGSDTITPAGSVSAPTFTGSALGTHTHGT